MRDSYKGRNDVWFGRETTPHTRTIGVAEADISLYFKALVTYCYKSNSQQQQNLVLLLTF